MKHCPPIARSVLVWLLTSICSAWATVDTVLILHTNDIHDHIRPGYEGAGGMPYVSGYIQSVKSQRPGVLVLDAGDVMEKGDMLAFNTESRIMYEALSRAGYHAGAVGNHDYDHGFLHLCHCLEHAPGYTLLCANWPAAEGSCIAPSKLFDADGVNVGVIGLMKPEEKQHENLAEVLNREAARLEPQAHLIVAVVHLSSKDCEDLSRQAPAIDVFISGHSHETLRKPKAAPATGAYIVQAGQYARYVGRLELTLDLSSEKILNAAGDLIEMRHDSTPCDAPMLAWIREQERALSPLASRIIGRSETGLNNTEAALLAAAALRAKAGTDIGCCHPGAVIRSGLPKGDLDVNALFLTGGQRGRSVVRVTLTGAQIKAYFEDLVREGWGRNLWDGFKAAYRVSPPGTVRLDMNLDPTKSYAVVMPELEWKARFLKAVQKRRLENTAPASQLCDFTFIDALMAYMEDLAARGILPETQVSLLRQENAL